MASKVLFALDVEDWANPQADDAVLRLCQLGEEAGVRWGLFVVAEKARRLVSRGRRDVIEAMARHEICYHLDAHGPFPEPVVMYSDRMDWDDALAKALLVESRGLRDVADIFGHRPVAWCQGEANWSPQLAAAMARLGVPLWNGAVVGADDVGPAWWCGSLVLRRAPFFCSIQPEADQRDLTAAFKSRFQQLLAEDRQFIIVFGHPTRWVFRDWWLLPELSLVRQRLVSQPAQIRYSRPPSYTADEVERWFSQTLECLRWCAALPDVELSTYSDVVASYQEPALRYVPLSELLGAIEPWVGAGGGRYDWVHCAVTTLSAADVFAALAWALARMAEGGRLPAEIPLRRPLGPTYPYPEQLSSTINISAARLLDLARRADDHIADTGAVPHAIRLANTAVSTAVLLLSFARATISAHRTGRLPDTMALQPAPPLPTCSEMSCFKSMAIGSHSLPEGFQPHRLRALAVMQSWSFRPAVNHRR